MKQLCMVTYTRKTEGFTRELIEMGNALSSHFKDFKCILFSEGSIDIPKEAEFEVEQIHMEGTKYRKIRYLLEKDDSQFYISLDNDITGQIQNLKEFASEVIHRDADIGWGKIMAVPKPNFISRLVAVDKVLSHYLIRPLLWKSGCGISIPGQCFMLKRKTFSGKLMEVDTFLDDLALGLYVNRSSRELKAYHYKKILGFERPNDSFGGLWKQRSRWAEGFSTIIQGVKDPVEKRLVLIHGFSYHCLWIINWLAFALLLLIHPALAAVYLILMSMLITGGNAGLFIYGLMYQFIFPIFHLRWMYCVKRRKR